jgi:hypothetical protein
MRFNNRACALMDIPDLPAMAFQHIGDKKIKPQGGGGGGLGDLVSGITDPISSALGTDGGDGGILGALADVDPGPAIGSGLAEVDKFVGREIPGGWTTVGAAAALGTGLYFAPEIMAAYGGEVGAQQALSSFTPEMLAYANASADPIMAINAISGMTPAEFALATNAAGAGVGSALMGPTYQELGITGVEGGLAGPTYAELGYTGLNNAEAIAAADAAAKAAAAKISITPSQAIQGLRMASGLLGGQQGAASGAGAATQFRGSTMPQGTVDYSGILNLLQARSPMRNPNSLLG